MNFNEIISFLGNLGLGGLLIILIKYFLDRKTNRNDALLNARLKTYGALNARVFNSFLESDIRSLPSASDRKNKINQVISESLLISSKKLCLSLLNLQVAVNDLYKEMGSKRFNEDKVSKIVDRIVELSPEIFKQMREDLK